jgi:hypothetical protein
VSEHPAGVHAGGPGQRRGRWPTPWRAVNELVGRLRDGVAAGLGERLVGLYLSGSLAAGDFDPAALPEALAFVRFAVERAEDP